MESIQLTKIAGGVLAALLVIVGTKTAIEFNSGHVDSGAPVGYTLDTDAGETAHADAGGAGATKGDAPAAAGFDAAKVVALVSNADAGRGEKTFKKCGACHTGESGAGNKVGPNLWGVVGREKGGVADFGGYSQAMKSKGGAWSLADLATFVHKPKDFVPGTKMVFVGIKKDDDIADLLAYLSTLK